MGAFPGVVIAWVVYRQWWKVARVWIRVVTFFAFISSVDSLRCEIQVYQ